MSLGKRQTSTDKLPEKLFCRARRTIKFLLLPFTGRGPENQFSWNHDNGQHMRQPQ